MSNITIIIVDYKSMITSCKCIKNYINNINDIERVNFIIVDNSCDDSNFYKAEREFELIEEIEGFKTSYIEIIKGRRYKWKSVDIYTIQSDRNAGYAKGNNIGVDYTRNILHDNPQYYIFSNNDIEFLSKINIEDYIRPFSMDDNIAVVGPKVIQRDGVQTSPRKKLSVTKLLITYNINLILSGKLKKYVDDVEYTNESGYAYWVMGCFLIVDSKKFIEAGMFDNNTFLYSEEMILAERLAKYNYRMYYNADCEILHVHGQTISSNSAKNASIKWLYDTHRYYCLKYRNVSQFKLFIADTVFKLYNISFNIKRYIKNITLKE